MAKVYTINTRHDGTPFIESAEVDIDTPGTTTAQARTTITSAALYFDTPEEARAHEAERFRRRIANLRADIASYTFALNLAEERLAAIEAMQVVDVIGAE